MLSSKSKNKRKSKCISVVVDQNGSCQQENNLLTFEDKNAPSLPMPDKEELESRFKSILTSIDLKDNQSQFLEDFSDQKKWHLICVTENLKTKEKPEYYVSAFKSQLEVVISKQKALKSTEEWSQKLVDLEISLRTNSIEWVKEFLAEEHNGLGVLMEYLQWAIEKVRSENESLPTPSTLSHKTKNKTLSSVSLGSGLSATSSSSSATTQSLSVFKKSSNDKTKQKFLHMAQNDIHYCILCLKAIMNHKNGFEMVYGDEKAINCLVLSLLNDSHRTKTFVLDLIAGMCMVDGGHSKVMCAFEHFKKVCGEEHRLQFLLKCFYNLDRFDINFMTACMRCLNLLVHSPQDMNYRVYLQYKLHLYGLTDFLQEVRKLGSEELNTQLDAYETNNFNVGELVKVVETSRRSTEKGDEVSKLKKKIEEIETRSLEKIVEFESKTSLLTKERDVLLSKVEQLEKTEASRDDVQTKQLSSPEKPLNQVQNGPLSPLATTPQLSANDVSETSFVTPPPPPPPPPAPPLPPLHPLGEASKSIVSNNFKTYKSTNFKSCNKLPALNWTSLNEAQIKNTVYEKCEEEKLYKLIDLDLLEEIFGQSTANANSFAPLSPLLEADKSKTISKAFKPSDLPPVPSLLNLNRQRNIAIARKKLNMAKTTLISAIENADVQQLNSERTDLLLRIAPTPEECQVLKEHLESGKTAQSLSENDQLLIELLKIQRLTPKLQVLSFINNHQASLQLLTPQVQAITTASLSVKKSKKFAQLIELVLAVGNYMNSRNRGAVYGFKLSNLEMLSDTKSVDKRQSLLHYIVCCCKKNFVSLLTFHKDFNFVEKASLASLESISTDIRELERDLSVFENEIKERSDGKVKSSLTSLHKESCKKVTKLKGEFDMAQDAFTSVASFFGENPKTCNPTSFFTVINKFMIAFKQAQKEVDSMNNPLGNRNSQLPNLHQGTINPKTSGMSKNRTYNREDMDYGTFDGIIRDLKNKPFLRLDSHKVNKER